MRLLYENLGWKLLAFALAVLLWFAVVGDPKVATSVSAPIEFRSLPMELEVSSEVPESVRLEVRGSPAQLEPRNLLAVAVVLDLSSVYKPGERTFTVSENNAVLPPGVRLIRAVPSQIRMRFERRASREVPVQVRYSGPPPRGYRISHYDVQPPQVAIVGPESRVNQIELAETDPIDLEAVVGEREFRVNTFVSDPQVRFQSVPEVTVTVWMEKIPSAEAP